MAPRHPDSSPTPNHTPHVARLSHVTLRYDSGTQALEDVSLKVFSGEHLCVLGANGSGKSTLASVLCGLLAPDAGRVQLVGENTFDSNRQDHIDFAAYQRARRKLGLVFQNPDDQLVTTVVEEDIAFGPENLGVPSDEIGTRVERELRRVAMTAYAKADPTRLSGGQKQRVAIAGALAMEPQLLVLDEPGSLLDVRGRSAIMRVMKRLRDAGTAIVHVTHFMEEALEADRVVVLDHGRIAFEGSPSDVFAHERELGELGLEEPFVARFSRRLGLPWTCDDDTLESGILASFGRNASIKVRQETRTQNDPWPTSNDRPEPNISPAQTVASFENVSFSYGRERPALDDVSLRIATGTSLALVGQTGSGKSTLLRLLCALEVPDTGHVVVDGIDTLRKRERRRLHGSIGYVMQHPERQLFAETVRADVAFGPENLGLSHEEVDRRCSHALELVGLTGLEDVSPFELSGGQQRLCALAGILAMEPHILVLDEPTAGLDPRGRHELRNILEDIHAHGVTIVQVTHSMEDAARAERVVVLDQAHVLLEGTPKEVFCTEHEQLLADAGLGLALPLTWALRLERSGFPSLGSPLTLSELVRAVEMASKGVPPWH